MPCFIAAMWRKLTFWAFFSSNCSYNGTFFKGLKVGRFEKMPPRPHKFGKIPPPNLFFSQIAIYYRPLFWLFCSLFTVIWRGFFDIVCHLSALLSSTSSNFKLGVVILSIILHFLKKNQKHLLSAKKVEKMTGNKPQCELKIAYFYVFQGKKSKSHLL